MIFFKKPLKTKTRQLWSGELARRKGKQGNLLTGVLRDQEKLEGVR